MFRLALISPSYYPILGGVSEQVADIGVEWARKQSEELLAHGVPALHFYVMQNANAVKKLMAKLKL